MTHYTSQETKAQIRVRVRLARLGIGVEDRLMSRRDSVSYAVRRERGKAKPRDLWGEMMERLK